MNTVYVKKLLSTRLAGFISGYSPGHTFLVSLLASLLDRHITVVGNTCSRLRLQRKLLHRQRDDVGKSRALSSTRMMTPSAFR